MLFKDNSSKDSKCVYLYKWYTLKNKYNYPMSCAYGLECPQ